MSNTSATPARTASLCPLVGVDVVVNAAPVTTLEPVKSARWHSAASNEKSAIPVLGDAPTFQALAPPTEAS